MTLVQDVIGQLGKVKFIFYSKDDNGGINFGVPYTPAYNPTSFSVSYSASYDEGKALDTGDAVKKFNYVNPRTLTMELFFDGTGASPSSNDLASKAASALGLPAVNTVDAQIETFIGLAYDIDGDIHKPRYIQVIWGTFILNGVLASANVNYLMFSPDGRPLRAKMSITINENVASTLLSKLLNKHSPDLSKSIVVKEGDTLPLLCYQEYGDSSLYPKIAEVNNLKNYRRLKQGMELLFPPIDNLA